MLVSGSQSIFQNIFVSNVSSTGFLIVFDSFGLVSTFLNTTIVNVNGKTSLSYIKPTTGNISMTLRGMVFMNNSIGVLNLASQSLDTGNFIISLALMNGSYEMNSGPALIVVEGLAALNGIINLDFINNTVVNQNSSIAEIGPLVFKGQSGLSNILFSGNRVTNLESGGALRISSLTSQ